MTVPKKLAVEGMLGTLIWPYHCYLSNDTLKQLDAVEACRAHNPEVPGSKPGVATCLGV